MLRNQTQKMAGGALRRLPSFGSGFNKGVSIYVKSFSAKKLFRANINHEYSRKRYN